MQLWISYAERTCRGWNALRLAAELADVRPDTPPYMLADLMEERGNPRLARLIQEYFACDPRGPIAYVIGPVSRNVPGPDQTGERGYVIV